MSDIIHGSICDHWAGKPCNCGGRLGTGDQLTTAETLGEAMSESTLREKLLKALPSHLSNEEYRILMDTVMTIIQTHAAGVARAYVANAGSVRHEIKYVGHKIAESLETMK